MRFYSAHGYSARSQCIRYYDVARQKRLAFLTSTFTLLVWVIADLHRCRWQVELFFKWIRQHLRIKSFCGTSEKDVKTQQVGIAACSYHLVAIMRKRLDLERSLHTALQVLSVSLFE